MLRAIVVVVCLASAGVIAAYTHYSRGDEPVYTVPVRAPDPPPALSAPAADARPIDPTDRAALARALQRELRRVGCYTGEITGVWTTSSRMAMRTFTERVNATLPVDNPDPVLLSLVQGHRDRACSAACPAGQTVTEGGACVPAGVAAKAGRTPPETRPEARPETRSETRSETERTGDASPGTAAVVAGTAAAVALAAPGAAKTDAKAWEPETKAATPAAPRPAAGGPGVPTGPGGPGGQSAGPAPADGLARDRRPRRTADAPPQRPPKIVRDVLKALGF